MTQGSRPDLPVPALPAEAYPYQFTHQHQHPYPAGSFGPLPEGPLPESHLPGGRLPEGQVPEGWVPGMPPPGRLARLATRLATRSPGWFAPAAVLACFAGAAAFVLYTDPTDAGAEAVPTCLVRLTTGFDCPGCGGTRAFYYALHGNIPAAARHHALFIFAVPFLVYMYVAWAGERVFHRRLPQLRVTPTMIGVLLAAWGVFTVVRNLPWAPFDWMYV